MDFISTMKTKFYTHIVYPLLFTVLRLPMKRSNLKIATLLSDTNALTSYIYNNITNRLTSIDPLKSDEETSRILADFKKLPLTTKMDLASKAESNELNRSSVIRRETTGTTGTPLTFEYSRQSIAEQMSVRSYAYKKIGVALGSREARFWGRKEAGFKHTLKNFVLNRKVFTFLGDEKNEICGLLSYKPDYIYGYSSLILNSIAVFKKHNIAPPSVKAIICTAENITNFQIEQIADFYQTTVAVEYGCTECDIIGYKLGTGDYEIVNPNLLLENSDKGVVITDFGNDYTKITRYCLGDDIKFVDDKELYIAGDKVKAVSGRTGNQIVELPGGESCHAVSFAHIVEDIHHEIFPILKFLVVQKTKSEFEFNLEPSNAEFDSMGKVDAIKNLLNRSFPNTVSFKIRIGKVVRHNNNKFDYFVSEI